MTTNSRTVIACSCEGTMPLDGTVLARNCGGKLLMADQLCRRQLDLLRGALSESEAVTIGCTQEQPLFDEIAQDMGREGALALANIRETGGWSVDAGAASPKMAALLAAASVEMPPLELVSMESKGVILILGRDETAIAAGQRLADHLDVTILLSRPKDVMPPRRSSFPVVKGEVARASGVLGKFELVIDGYALPAPSSRSTLEFGPTRDGAVSACDIVLDLTGERALFPAHDLRPGYLRADPNDPAAVERAIFDATQLVGAFDKPRYIRFDAGLCAHSRSKITGCTRCLDLCPTGAIAPAGDTVAIDPEICAGCGQCAAACPTGAASYALPPVDALAARLRVLLRTFRDAGGRNPLILFHDGEHGDELIDALARYGDGLPATVLPLQVNEITQVGPELLASAFAYGASGVRFLGRAKPKHDLLGLTRILETTSTILGALGYGEAAVGLIETDDPDSFRSALLEAVDATTRRGARETASFLPVPSKRGLLELAFRELHRVAPTPVDVVPLAAGAPFGGITVDVEGCTLCLACVSACPADALSDNPDRPTLRFTESLCVQCGLCAATCPENVITIEPRLDFAAWAEPKKLIKEEEPFHCISCSKPFGTRATIERVMGKLGAGHWMFTGEQGSQRLRVLQMCEDCRVEAVVNESFDPHEGAEKRMRTTDDYLLERKGED